MSKIKWSDKMIKVLLGMYDNNTYAEIAQKISKKFKVKVSENGARKAYERYKYPVLDKAKKDLVGKPKILLFDIETMPMEFYAWSLYQDRLNLNMMKKDWSVLSYAAKWMDEDKIFYEDTEGQSDIGDDKRVLKKIWKLLDEADIVVGHNSNRFDVKKLNARFILHGMSPPSSYKRLDTLVIAKRHFSFTSNKLSYLTENLCKKHKKSSHNEFPGFAMWLGCINKNKRAFKSMKEYNILDVTSLEELFKVLLPWENANLFNVYYNQDKPQCTCGSTSFKKNGFYTTNAARYQKYRCTNKICGAEYRDSKNLISKNKTKMSNTLR